jgi:hypothetical protein
VSGKTEMQLITQGNDKSHVVVEDEIILILSASNHMIYNVIIYI